MPPAVTGGIGGRDMSVSVLVTNCKLEKPSGQSTLHRKPLIKIRVFADGSV